MTVEVIALDGVSIGVLRGAAGTADEALGRSLALTLAGAPGPIPDWVVDVPDVEAALAAFGGAVTARTLVDLLRVTSVAPVREGLIAESLAYSMLMSGAEYRAWLAARTRREVPEPVEPAVLLEREGGILLAVTLNVPGRHNAFSRWVRDGLCEAFDLVAADDSVSSVQVRGNGSSFCSGGDLDEFGTTPDLAAAHLIRQDRGVAARIDAVRERVTVHLHGACIGAGIELASFGGRVMADPSTVIRLPELAMGLVPGAGGTVGITRRIGRWRTAFIALTSEALPLEAALRWGLVDELAP